MKKFLFFTLLALFAFMGCKQAKPVKTIENLKAGIKGETTASVKYAAFAQKAREEGNDTIAKLFDAASKAESIHAVNHLKILEGLGEKMNEFKPEFEVKTTAQNTLPFEYAVCPVCGNTYDKANMDANCAFCMTPSEKFIIL